MITIKSGPAWPSSPRSLAEALELSLCIARPEQVWSSDDMERAHAWIELMLLEQEKDRTK
jgi:hypothetical protein